jgi:hypothetical protein
MSVRLTLLCSTFLLSLGVAEVQAAQFVVVEARGIAWRPGRVLDAGKPVHLAQGQHVTVISDSGAVLKLDGPYDKVLASAQTEGIDVAATLAGLTAERQARLGAVGATRAPEIATLPDPWVLDASRGGNVCLREGQTAIFWRPAALETANFVIMPSDRSWKARSKWSAGTDRLSLRRDLAVHGSASYIVRLDDTESAITVNTVPAALSNDKMRVAWMAAKGCDAQAEALVRASR